MNVLISPFSESSILPEDLATQSVKLKEEQLRREEEKVCCVPKATHFHTLTLHVPLATRDRASGAARDQREEAGAVGEGGIAQVSTS